ncbi:MAG: DUF4131 domain-containing protein, partial [Paracoccaceae bacterium]
MARLWQWPLEALLAARGSLFAWVPILIGCGVAVWFALPWEPGLRFYLGAGLVAGLALWFGAAGPEIARPVAVAAGCIAIGMLACGLRVHLMQAPVLGFRYYGPIQGRIVEIDRSQTDALRLTLDRVVLDRVDPDRTPHRVRVSLHDAEQLFAFDPGQVVMLTGHLDAPQGPVEPGGFDFARMAYFDGLGAVGYTRNPVMLWSPPAAGEQGVNRLRT